MDDSLPTTPARSDTVSDETDDSTKSKWDPKDDGVVLAHSTVEGLVIPLAPSADDPPAHDAPNFAALDFPNSSAQDA